MTVILVLVTFLVFIVLDYVLNRGKAVVTVPAAAPEDLAYRPGMPGSRANGRALSA